MKYKWFWIVLISILIALTLCFIWGNSLESTAKSQAKSTDLLEKLQPILDAALGPGKVTDHVLRKTAHFVEFTLLGIELRLLFWLLGQRGVQGQANALFAALAAAVADETIQSHTGRGSQLKDVCLDFSGAVIGSMALFLLALLVVYLRKRRKQPR